MTEYVIFKKVEGDRNWQVLPGGRVEAISTRAALRGALGKDATGEYVAVPARSWQPVKVQVETALKFS